MSQKELIQELVKQAGTDSSGKWMSVYHAEKFARLVIEAYNKNLLDFSTQLDQNQS